MKIDIRKTYNSVQWDCIEEILLGLRFPNEFIKWIMVCVKSPIFFIMINGKPGDFFKRACGIRQGDPMPPLLLVLMFYSSFARVRSGVLSKLLVLQHFYEVSGLQINEQKSCIYFSGVKKLSKDDCNGLIEKITKRISHWTVRHLSYASGLQLVNAVLFSMQVYWCSMFILPVSVSKGVEKLCKFFYEKGLLTISMNKFKLLSFWGTTKPLNASWSWRNLIKLRQEMKGCFEYSLGKGELSFWHDPWLKGQAIIEVFLNI
ncbi:uncharacterized protein LOC130015416 [Mercurialis annua]|uniref:uncharacterized protein LOC130015416 n=1 Tax=Mercurialis annua TaxID=3986 RepID=UPI0024AE92D5|nr:uncharacterized protein LOC130015416 [Mercurialis annua]